jgi:hypothetical protein
VNFGKICVFHINYKIGQNVIHHYSKQIQTTQYDMSPPTIQTTQYDMSPPTIQTTGCKDPYKDNT